MPTQSPPPSRLPLPEIPEPLLDVIARLHDAGCDAAFSGPCVADWLRGDPPSAIEVTTTASGEQTLRRFRRGVRTRALTTMVPTDAGPVDVTSVGDIAASLALRDFTQHAMAYDPGRSGLFDPFEGRAHVGAKVLVAVGSPDVALAADPLRALRALRLVATLGIDLDAGLIGALGDAAPRVTHCAPNRLRFELCALLMGRHATAGLELLRSSGIEKRFANGIGPSAAALVGALPFDLDLRMSGWLLGARSAGVLRRIRYPRARARQVDLRVGLHPVDESVNVSRESHVRRLLKRIGSDNLASLIRLRSAEIELAGAPGSASADIETLRSTLEQIRVADERAERRTVLAIDGAGVMDVLGCPAGPVVGLALRHLAECVERDASINDRRQLAALLESWTPPAVPVKQRRRQG